MIISASRRTDIPAFYSPWLIQRLREGFCTVPNPFNARQVQRISLRSEEVAAIVFWTRQPRPLFPYLDELDGRGYRYYFQFTLLDYPRSLDRDNPPYPVKLDAFRALSDRLGQKRVIWRYDPILFTRSTPAGFHLEKFGRIAEALQGFTSRVVVSLLTPYRKIAWRMRSLEGSEAALIPGNGMGEPWLAGFLSELSGTAARHGMEITSCASELDMQPCGIRPGKCIDDALLRELFGLEVSTTKDPGQRKLCGCVVSKDIGTYDTCTFGCQYCYATSSFARARRNHSRHDPRSESLIG